MLWFLLGCCGFLPLYLFDWNKIGPQIPVLNACFPLGFLMIAAGTGGVLLAAPAKPPALWLQVLFYALAATALALELYALFFALPFEKTYVSAQKGTLVSDGMYALCRHPGVLWFAALYLCLWLARGQGLMLWTALAYTALDIVHVFVQDRFCFPKMLAGYEAYRQETPFLVPNGRSVRRALRRREAQP